MTYPPRWSPSSRIWDWAPPFVTGFWTSWLVDYRWWGLVGAPVTPSFLTPEPFKVVSWALLPVYTGLYSHTQLQHHGEICRWHGCGKSDLQWGWGAIPARGRVTVSGARLTVWTWISLRPSSNRRSTHPSRFLGLWCRGSAPIGTPDYTFSGQSTCPQWCRGLSSNCVKCGS